MDDASRRIASPCLGSLRNIDHRYSASIFPFPFPLLLLPFSLSLFLPFAMKRRSRDDAIHPGQFLATYFHLKSDTVGRFRATGSPVFLRVANAIVFRNLGIQTTLGARSRYGGRSKRPCESFLLDELMPISGSGGKGTFFFPPRELAGAG